MALFLIDKKYPSFTCKIFYTMNTISKILVSICLGIYSYSFSFAQSHITPTLPEFYKDASHGKDETPLKLEKNKINKNRLEKAHVGLPLFLHHQKVDQIKLKAQKDILRKSTQKYKNKATVHI